MRFFLKKILLVFLFVGSCNALFSNNLSYKGVVKDSLSKKCIEGVTIMLKNSAGTILKYTSTNKSGEWNIQAQYSNNDVLTFSMLGYEAKTIKLNPSILSYNVFLKEAATVLNEVVVKSPRITLKGDTISYNVNNFSDIKDKNLADVLKKMPGIEVDKSGEVKYQGEAINKLYIDGKDLLGNKYNLATNNISPDKVKTVDVLENHQPKKALRDKVFSDKAALNINLKDDAKSMWQKSADLAAGMREKSDYEFPENGGKGLNLSGRGLLLNERIFLMNFSSNYTSMNLLRFNNCGNVYNEMYSSGISNDFAGFNDYSLGNYISVAPESAPLAENRVRFNQTGLVNTNNNFALSEDLNLSLQVSYLFDKLKMANSFKTNYYLPDKEIETVENRGGVEKNNSFYARAELLANTSKYYFTNKLNVVLDKNFITDYSLGSFPNEQEANFYSKSLSNDFQYIRNFTKTDLTITSTNKLMENPQNLSVYKGSNVQRQSVENKAFFSNTDLAIGYKLKGYNFNLSGGFTQLCKKFNSLYNSPDNKFINDLNINYSKPYITPSLNYKSKKLNARLSVPISLYYYNILDKIGANSAKESVFLAGVSGNLQYIISPYFETNVYASYLLNANNEKIFIPNYFLSNYRYFERGIIDFSTNANSYASVALNYKDPLNSMFSYIKAGYAQNRLSMIAQRDFVGDYIYSYYIPFDGVAKSYFANFSFSKGLDNIHGKAKIDLQYSASFADMAQNGVVTPFRSDGIVVNPSFNFRIAKGYNVEYSLTYSYSKLNFNSGTSSTDRLFQRMKVVLSPIKKLSFEVNGEHYVNKISGSKYKNTLFLDVSACYFISKKVKVEVLVNNILNKGTFEYSVLKDLSYTQAAYAIRPMDAMVSVNFNF